MRFAKLLLAVLTVGMIGSVTHADDFDKRVTFTVDQPFMIPGASYTHHKTSIPAGTYNIRFMHDQSPQTVAYLFDENDQYLVATAIPIKYNFPEGRYTDAAYDKLIQFESSARMPGYLLLRRWLYPGDSGGWEFVGKEQQQE